MKKYKTFAECTKAEKLARWNHVLKVLQGLTPHQRKEHWDMQTFGYETSCGTIACAAGHCAMDPWFQKRGLVGKIQKDHGEMEFPQLKPAPFFDDETWNPETGIHLFTQGADKIFFNPAQRPVSQVIKEVKQYIKVLTKELRRE